MALPVDIGSLLPVGSLLMSNFDVPVQSWTNGFPGLPAQLSYLREWYGVSCTGLIYIHQTGPIILDLTSDDGSRLSIEGHQIISDDGVHGLREKSAITTLTQGWHPFKLDWFQGPRYQIGLILQEEVGSGSMQIVPPSDFGSSGLQACVK
jgi:hypothetical protein